jgi:aspartyl protease family protein
MVFPLVRNVTLAVLAGWLLYQVQGRLLVPGEPHLAQPDDTYAAGPAITPRAAALEQGAGRSMTILPGRNGHYEVEARVNGKAVRFMIDTGATGIVLNLGDAERVGLRPRQHDFTQTAHTANGVVAWAPVVLRDLRVGALTLGRVQAAVNGGPLDVSLLGMSFLGRLKGYEVRNGRLVLYW